jgi:replication factor C large subunit
LKKICEKEEIKFDDGALRELAKHCDGDLRSAMIDLEKISVGKNEISSEDLKLLDYREKGLSVFDALKIIFKTQNALAAKMSITDVDKDPDEVFWWIENNIPNEYEEHVEIVKAYDMLSKADLFRQWIKSRQNWRFLDRKSVV